MRRVLATLTDEQLAAGVTRPGPDRPQPEDVTVEGCLRVVLVEEWEHRLYAERDLTALGAPGA